MTRPAAKPSAGQERAVECARELAEAAATVQRIAAYPGVSTQHPGQFFYVAYTASVDRLRDLLASLDEAGTAQADPDGDPPHAYIPAGPVEAAPYRLLPARGEAGGVQGRPGGHRDGHLRHADRELADRLV